MVGFKLRHLLAIFSLLAVLEELVPNHLQVRNQSSAWNSDKPCLIAFESPRDVRLAIERATKTANEALGQRPLRINV
jgi:hypothetical protein